MYYFFLFFSVKSQSINFVWKFLFYAQLLNHNSNKSATSKYIFLRFSLRKHVLFSCLIKINIILFSLHFLFCIGNSENNRQVDFTIFYTNYWKQEPKWIQLLQLKLNARNKDKNHSNLVLPAHLFSLLYLVFVIKLLARSAWCRFLVTRLFIILNSLSSETQVTDRSY